VERARNEADRASSLADDIDSARRTRSTTHLAKWQVLAKLAGVTRDHTPWVDVQMQRGRSPLPSRPGTVTLKHIAGMVSGKSRVPGVNVISVMICVRIVTHSANIASIDSSSQYSERRQCAERGQQR
jgi:hypothetical protein